MMIKHLIQSLFLVLLILTLIGCSSGSAPTHTNSLSTPRSTPTRIASGTVLFQSDWSQGLAAWGNPPGWKLVHGIAQSEVSDKSVLTLPYISAAPDYLFVVRFQIVSVPKNGGYFLLVADDLKGKDGYTAGVLALLSPAPHNEFDNPQIQVYLNKMDDMGRLMVTSDYEPGTSWHTFGVEVRGSYVGLSDNGLRKSFATSTQTDFLSNGPLHIESAGAVINVSSVRVTAL